MPDRKLTKNDVKFLRHFSNGAAERPKGMGAAATTNFVQRKWIERVESERDFAEPRYALTAEGLRVLQTIDQPEL